MPDSIVSSHGKSMFGRSDFLIFHYHSYKKTFARVSVLIWSERDKQHRENYISYNTETLIVPM